jgi:hypothetical protein
MSLLTDSAAVLRTRVRTSCSVERTAAYSHRHRRNAASGWTGTSNPSVTDRLFLMVLVHHRKLLRRNDFPLFNNAIDCR